MAKRRRSEGNGGGVHTSRRNPPAVKETGTGEAVAPADMEETVADSPETATSGADTYTRRSETATSGADTHTRRSETVTSGADMHTRRSERVTGGVKTDAGGAGTSTGCSRGSEIGSENMRQRWANRCMIVELAVIILLMLCFLFLFRKYRIRVETAERWMPEYEDNALSDTDGTEEAGGNKEISIAVMHNYLVNRDQPDFTVGYPDQNTYEIEISFRDSESGKEKYHTKRIAPGTQIPIPGYGFCEDGINRMDAVISIFRQGEQMPVSDSTIMQFQVTKE